MRFFLVVALALLLATVAYCEENLELRVSPRFCLPPCTLTLTIHVPRHKDNRWLVLYWSDVRYVSGYGGGSNIPLQGEASQTQFVRELKDIPEGAYLVAAQLHRINLGNPVGYEEMMVYVGTAPEEGE